MKLLVHSALTLISLCGPALADIEIRVSPKFILTTSGNQPGGRMGTTVGFNAEITRANAILANTGRGMRLVVVSAADIDPSAPAGEAASYWRTLAARSNRAAFEAAAIAAKGTWSWSDTAINFFINGSSSGQCSFVGDGLSISLGADAGAGTVLHELGHYFNLRHTHDNDPNCDALALPNPRNMNTLGLFLSDGDGLTETANDHACFDDPNLLSQGHFNKNYVALNAGERAFVDSSLNNVMSYHDEDVLLDVQMDIWTKHANNERRFATNGRTWFVSNSGNNLFSGLEVATSVQTVATALGKVNDADDVILLRGGYYVRPAGGLIQTPCTLLGTRGLVTIGE